MATIFSKEKTEPAQAGVQITAGRLALGAAAGPLLFTLAWLVLGFISPGYTLFGNHIAPYSPISQPISGLGLGLTAPYMNAAFVLGGLIMLTGVAAAFKAIHPAPRPAVRWGSAALIALSPLGMMMAGIFTLEAMLPHLAGFLLATASPVVGFAAAGLVLRTIPGWRRFGSRLILGSPLTLVLVTVFFLTFDPAASGANQGTAGLTQRVLVLEVQAWFAALGWLAYRRSA